MTEMNDEDMKAMKEFISTGVEEGLVWKGLKVSAYASPDGEMDKNANLANDRANTAAKAIQRELKRKKKLQFRHFLFPLSRLPHDNKAGGKNRH